MLQTTSSWREIRYTLKSIHELFCHISDRNNLTSSGNLFVKWNPEWGFLDEHDEQLKTELLFLKILYFHNIQV